MICFCCSGKEFADCCQPFIDERAKPATAEELMRSRYSAYATIAVKYLVRTTHPATRKFCDAQSIERWAQSNDWQKLEIVATSEGGAKDKRGTVEFKAYFLDPAGQPQIHREISDFRRELGKWFFVKGRILQTQILL